MTIQPKIRVKNKYNEHTYMMTVKPDETNHDYTINVPSDPYRKAFSDNEIWSQIKIYSDTDDCRITCKALCYDAEYNLLAEYFQNTDYEGVIPFACNLGNRKSFTLCDETDTRLLMVSPSPLPVGNYVTGVLLNGGDYPLTNHDVKVVVTQAGKSIVDTTVKTDGKGRFTVPELLHSGTYTVKFTYEGATVNDVTFKPCYFERKIAMEGLHETAVEIPDTFFTKQEVFHMIKDSQGTFRHITNSYRIIYVLGSDLYVYLKDKEDGTRIAGEKITIKVGNQTYTSTTNDRGVAVFQVYLNAGDYPLTITYKGTDYYDSCTNDTDYRLVVRKSQVSEIICTNTMGTTYFHTTKTGNLGFQLRETYDGDFDNDNFFINPTNGKVYHDATFQDEWDEDKLLEATLRTTTKKITYTSISRDSNHNRMIEFSKSPDENGTYTAVSTQRVKGYERNIISASNLASSINKGYWVKAVFNGDNYFKSATWKNGIVYPHKDKGHKDYQLTKTNIELPSTKYLISSKGLKFRVRSSFGEYLRGQRVTFVTQGKSYLAKIDDEGYVSFPATLSVGRYTVTARFEATDYFDRCSVKYTFRVIPEKENVIVERPIRYLANFNGHLIIPEDINAKTKHIQYIYTVTVPEHDKNVHIYFNSFMLNIGSTQIDYIEATDEEDIVNYKNSYYALLYMANTEGNGIEVIRPSKDNFTVKNLTKCEETVISPFHKPSIKEDKPNSICKEFLNFHYQHIRISQDNQ